jgi:hypothetical protein
MYLDLYASQQSYVDMQEMITGEIPFRELKSGHAIMMAVTQEKRTPRVPELQTEPISPRATLMLGILHRCWRYDPDERATADEVLVSVRSSNSKYLSAGMHLPNRFADGYPWTGLRVGRWADLFDFVTAIGRWPNAELSLFLV